jgi:Mg2+-importing ATPase
MDRHRLICKGAPESVFNRCTQFELDGELYPMDQLLLEDLKEEYDRLSADGFRVLALAYSDSDPKPAYSKDDEHNLILKGYVAFLDPPKETVAPAITALQQHGIAVKVLTGDNELVSRKCPFQRMRWIQNKWPSRGHGLWGRSRGSFFLLDLAARFLITRRMQ